MRLGYPGSQANPAPRPIVSMSLRPAIPRRVALQQSPPPLHRLLTMLRETGKLDKENSANGNCVFSSVSHPRGSPQGVRPYVPTSIDTSKPNSEPLRGAT